MKVLRVLLALMVSVVTGSAAAQYPNRPIRFIVPIPAGSATDTLARALGHSVSRAVGQPVVVENRPGADGAIGALEVIKANPDGYTLLVGTNGPIASVPALRKQPPYDPLVDLTPIADLIRFMNYIFVHPSVPANTFVEFIKYAKAQLGNVTYGTGNTTGIVSFAQIKALAGIDMLHVPYKGEPAAMIDVMAGRVQVMMGSPQPGLTYANAGKLRLLASLQKQRSSLMPDIPTVNESLPMFSIDTFAALYGPAKMPRQVTQRINQEIVAAMKSPEVVAVIEKQSFIPSPSTPDELAAFTRRQVHEVRRLLRAAGIQPE